MYLKLYYDVKVSAEYERKVTKIPLGSLAYMLFCSIFLLTQIILQKIITDYVNVISLNF